MFSVEECSLVDVAGNVLWTRCRTCGTALLSPSTKYCATCRNSLMCFLRFYRNHVRAAYRAWRPTK